MVVQLVRMAACHAAGRGFKSRPLRSLLPSMILLIYCSAASLRFWLMNRMFDASMPTHCSELLSPACLVSRLVVLSHKIVLGWGAGFMLAYSAKLKLSNCISLCAFFNSLRLTKSVGCSVQSRMVRSRGPGTNPKPWSCLIALRREIEDMRVWGLEVVPATLDLNIHNAIN